MSFPQAMKNVIEMGGLPAITVMLHSSHPRMVNEAIVSLTILSAGLITKSSTDQAEPEDEDALLVHRHLHTDLVINGVKKCLNEAKFPKEIRANTATFILTLLKVRESEFKQMLKDLNFVEECLDRKDTDEELPEECEKLATYLLQ